MPTFGIPAARYEVRIAGGSGAFLHSVEGAEDDMTAGRAAASGIGPCDVAIGVAASGRTPFVIGALEEARTRGATTIGIACTARPALGTVADIVIAVDTGPEVIAGSTRMKAGTVQKLVLNAFSTALMVRVGRVYGNRMVEMQVTNEKLRHRAARLVGDVAGVDEQRARTALGAADGDIKTAIAALRLGIPTARAREPWDGSTAACAEHWTKATRPGKLERTGQEWERSPHSTGWASSGRGWSGYAMRKRSRHSGA